MQQSIKEMILEKFADYIRNDSSFNGISDDLINVVSQDKPKKDKIDELLRKQHDENTESRDK